MSRVLRVQWTIVPITPPQPILACNRCKQSTPFASSDKFRLNANGKRLDAWLIYRCVFCDNTWNRPIFERKDARAIRPGLLSALQSNDQFTATSVAFDTADLRRHTHRINEFTDVAVQKQVLCFDVPKPEILEITLNCPKSCGMRTDRLLANELDLSRTKITEFGKRGALQVPASSRRALRQAVKNGLRVRIDLRKIQNADTVITAAISDLTKIPANERPCGA